MLTSRDPRWKRDDVTRRLLPIRMATIEGPKQPEHHLQRVITQERPRILGALLEILNATVLELRQQTGPFTSSHRLADFHCLGQAAARALGLEEDFNEAMRTLDTLQLDLLGEGDERLELLGEWVDSKPPSLDGDRVSSRDCYEALRGLHAGPERAFPFKNATALGTWLGRHKDLISSKLGVTVTPDRSSMTRRWIFAKVTCHGDTESNRAEYEGLAGHDSMTPPSAETVPDASLETEIIEDAC